MERKPRTSLGKDDGFQRQNNDGFDETVFLQTSTPEVKPKSLNYHKINGCGNG